MKKLLLLFLFPLFLLAQFTTMPPGGAGGGISEATAQGIVQNAVPITCTDAGVNDSYTCTINPAPAAASDIKYLWLDPNTANTGAATLDIGPGAALKIFKHADGTELADNDLRANVPTLLVYCASCDTGAGAWVISGLGNLPSGTDDQTAAEVVFTPAGDIEATDTQAAIEELDSEKASVASLAGVGWTKYTIAETALTTASLTEDETLFACAQLCKIEAVVVKHSAAFTGNDLTAMTVSVGVSGDEDFYTQAHNIFQAAADTTFQDTNVFGSATMAAAGHNVIARFTAEGDNVVNAAAGAVDIWIKVSTLP